MDGEGARSVIEEDMHMIVVVYYPAYLKKIAQITRVFAAWQEMRSLRVVVNNPAISESHAESVFSNVASHTGKGRANELASAARAPRGRARVRRRLRHWRQELGAGLRLLQGGIHSL